MSGPVLVDTGPLVAYLVKEDAHHAWVCEQFARLKPPLLTCEVVLAEAAYLAAQARGDSTRLLELVHRGILQVGFSLEDEALAVRQLMRRYADLPMSLADACLVRMTETRPQVMVFTLDGHFKIYRRNQRQVIPLVFPS